MAEEILDEFGGNVTPTQTAEVPKLQYNLDEIYNLIDKAENEKVIVEKIIFSSTVNTQELAMKYKTLLKNSVAAIEKQLEDAVETYKAKIAETTLSKQFSTLLLALNKSGWSLFMETPTRLFAYKNYEKKPLAVKEGKYENGRRIILTKPCCYIYALLVNITCKTLTGGSVIKVISENQHPNVDLTTYACVGNLDGRPIPREPEALVKLLTEIELTYKYFYPESCYNSAWKSIPIVQSKKGDNVWSL